MLEAFGHKEYIAGFLAGVATVAAGHPFDTVKVTLQKHNIEQHNIKYKNSLHCAAKILQIDGVKGLYKGAVPSFVGVAFESSLFFGIYSQMKKFLQGGMQSNAPETKFIVPSAAFSGAIISFVLCPTELVKCRMQVQGTNSPPLNPRRYNGPLDCVLRTVKNDGVRAIFRGGFATFLRESIGSAIFFSTYEHTRYHLHSRIKDHGYVADIGIGIISGGLGGISFWSVVLPLDVAKTIIQTSYDGTTTNPFRALFSIYKKTGLRGCYTGLGPTLMRAFPANAAAIVTWEMTTKLLGNKHAEVCN